MSFAKIEEVCITKSSIAHPLSEDAQRAREEALSSKIVRRRPRVSPTQSLDGDSLIGDPSNLSLHDKRLPAERAQEGVSRTNCTEMEASTLLELDANEILSNNKAITGADTPPVPAGGISETEPDAVQLAGAQPPTAPPADMPTKKKRNRLSKDMRETIIQLRLAGHSALHIALFYGLATAQVERVLYQYVVALGHSLPPTKYSISKGGSPIKNAELLGISKDDYVRIDVDSKDEITLKRFQLDQERDSSAAPVQPKRKYTKAEQNALDEKILHLIEEGHPGQAIALMCGVNTGFVGGAILRLLLRISPAFNGQKYDVIKGNCLFTRIRELNITKDDYVRIERNEADKLVITKLDVSTLQDLSI